MKCDEMKRNKKIIDVIKLFDCVDDNAMHEVRILNTNSEVIVPEFMLERTLSEDHLPEGTKMWIIMQ